MRQFLPVESFPDVYFQFLLDIPDDLFHDRVSQFTDRLRHHIAECQNVFQQTEVRFELAQDGFVGQQLGQVVFIQRLLLHDLDGLFGE